MDNIIFWIAFILGEIPILWVSLSLPCRSQNSAPQPLLQLRFRLACELPSCKTKWAMWISELCVGLPFPWCWCWQSFQAQEGSRPDAEVALVGSSSCIKPKCWYFGFSSSSYYHLLKQRTPARDSWSRKFWGISWALFLRALNACPAILIILWTT